MKKNILLQSLYQILVIIIPLITTPYITRVLGVENIGIYSFSYSYTYYFTMIAMLGFTSYGSKQIAIYQSEQWKRNHTFYEIYFAQLCMSIFAGLLFACFVAQTDDINMEYIMTLQGIYVIACFFDVNWYFFGRELFNVTVTRNIVVKLLSLASIFIFVKTKQDLDNYIILMASSQLINNIIVTFLALRMERFYVPKIKDVLIHLKESLVLFIPMLAMSLYHLTDKTMLGILSNSINSGYYYSADKVINIPLCFVFGIGVVALPRISSMISEGKNEDSNILIIKMYRLYMCLSAAMTFGIIAVAPEFVPWFFGNDYSPCILLVTVMAMLIPFKAISDMFKSLFFIPKKENKYFILSVSVGGVTNLVLNYWLINQFSDFGALGATISTVFTEFLVCAIQAGFVINALDIKVKEVVGPFSYFIFGFVMYLGIRWLSTFALNGFRAIVVETLIGFVIYISLCITFRKDDLKLTF